MNQYFLVVSLSVLGEICAGVGTNHLNQRGPEARGYVVTMIIVRFGRSPLQYDHRAATLYYTTILLDVVTMMIASSNSSPLQYDDIPLVTPHHPYRGSLLVVLSRSPTQQCHNSNFL